MTNSESRRSRSAGFTLLECVVAIAIIGGGIVAGLELTTTQMTINERSLQTSEAQFHLERELELVRLQVFDALKTTDFAAVPEDPSYEIRRVITEVDAYTKIVQLEVRYFRSALRTDTLSLIRCRAGDVGSSSSGTGTTGMSIPEADAEMSKSTSAVSSWSR